MCLVFVLLSAAASLRATASDLEFHAPPGADDPTTPTVMQDLAARLLPVYQDPDPDRYLANLSALQMVAGDYASGYASRQELRARQRGRPVSRAVIYDMYAYAKALEADDRVPFAEAFTKSFREVVSRLNDADAYLVTGWLETSPTVFREALQKSLDQQRAQDSIDQPAAVQLLWTYLIFDAYRSFAPLIASLDSEEDQRRYLDERNVSIKTRDGSKISALVVRPRSASKPLTALLEFAIDVSQNHAKECAAHGYVGVMAYTRGKRDKSYGVVPYQHDGDDARAVINWIAKQPWSDARVAMYGDGYSGFAAWAAAARPVPALKAIATSASIAPGIDFPMFGNIFRNSAYRWSLQVTNEDASLDGSYDDQSVWRKLNEKWYRSGKRYRDLGRLYGKPNPIFIRWLNHPSYDRFWQKMVPYREQFAHINIPVLTTTGYFAPNEPGALYYFQQHYRYNSHADHTLVVGPYDDSVVQRGPQEVLRGYEVDSAALIDLRELRYQWFDHIFKGSAKPALLKDRINYEVMGANEWHHARSVEAMSGSAVRFYLDAAGAGEGHRLTRHKNSRPTAVRQTVSLLDRTDAAWTPPTALISERLVAHHGLMFVSEPLANSSEFNGLLSGRLDFAINKMDVDLNIMLYERLGNGQYVRLFNPAYEFRASYALDRVHRHLLKAGERQQLTFKTERITSRRLQAGSRLVMVLSINKRPDREINYGTGNDVSEESIADGSVPLRIRWYSDSYIEVPMRK
jgi:putative CocE/NonD family hydrolase